MKTFQQNFDVPFSYPVVFTRNAFNADSLALREVISPNAKVICYLDQGVADAHPKLVHEINHYFSDALVMPPRIVPGGEAIKNNYRLTMEMVDGMLEHRLDRHAVVLAIGGGAVLDAVGFATSIVHRGLRLVRMPTTTLAQNDAGIGVKNGMNLHGGKNTIGTFYPPVAVINDFSFLGTLSDVSWRDGISEAFKVAMIKDADFFHELCALAPRFNRRDPEATERMIVRCAELHLEHIATSGDPFERGSARPLDFGHWSAHKLESMSNYRISHGQAVATGIALDAGYALQQDWLSQAEYDELIAALLDSGIQLWHDELDLRLGDGALALLGGLEDFREHLGGQLCLTFPKGIGQKIEVHEHDSEIFEASLALLRKAINSHASAEAS